MAAAQSKKAQSKKTRNIVGRNTRDHVEILEWASKRGADPAIADRTGGVLRFRFQRNRASTLDPVDWDEFFRIFDERGLVFIYDIKPHSRFHKFVYPQTISAKARGQLGKARSTRKSLHSKTAVQKRASRKGAH